jgi:hypothetical protein
LISVSDAIEIKGAAASITTKEKEFRDAELALLQASVFHRSTSHARV